jgi:site-specific DNA-methyltransferase (adenine-specific)
MQIENKNLEYTGLTYSSVNPGIYEQYQKTKDAELFENLVSDLILNKYSTDKEVTGFISSLPKENKRLAILSLIDGDNVLWSKMKSFVDNCTNKMDHIKDVIKIINQFVEDGDVEKRKFGEVMTPIWLVREMLDTLPKEVWSNPNLKWLDPANGAGTFPFVVIVKLMIGLSEWQPDVEKRYKHIVENMIYTCELQSRNVFLWMCGVDPKDEYATNTYWGSFLDPGFDKHMKEVWNIEKFDIVIGNPPYQKSDGSGGKGSSALPIYNEFTEKSIKLSNIVLFVTPSRWFSNGRGLDKFREKMISLDGLFLIKHFPGNGSEIFGKGVEIKGGVSYFLINDKVQKNIIFNDVQINKTDIKKYGFLFDNAKHYLILDKIKTKSNLFFDSVVQSSNHFGKIKNGKKTLRNSKECVGEKIDDDYLKCYVSKKEGFVKFVHKDFINLRNYDKFKIFTVKGTNVGSMGNTFIAKPFEICTETYLTIYCDSEEESNNKLTFLKTNLSKYLFKLLNITQNSSKDTYCLIPLLDFDTKWSDEKLYSFFNFNESEILHIEDFLKN